MQTKPRVYVIGEIDVKDNECFVKEFVPKVQNSIRAAGGRFLISGGSKITPLEGTAPKRLVMHVWDSLDKVQNWYESTEYKEVKKIGDKCATFRIFVVEGLPQQ